MSISFREPKWWEATQRLHCPNCCHGMWATLHARLGHELLCGRCGQYWTVAQAITDTRAPKFRPTPSVISTPEMTDEERERAKWIVRRVHAILGGGKQSRERILKRFI